jgi:hypothetical protein
MFPPSSYLIASKNITAIEALGLSGGHPKLMYFDFCVRIGASQGENIVMQLIVIFSCTQVASVVQHLAAVLGEHANPFFHDHVPPPPSFVRMLLLKAKFVKGED